MKFSRFFVLPLLFSGAFLSAQTPAGLFRYPDVSEKHIVFSCANNLWLVAKQGGEAVQLSSPPGMESFPKFSPDGSKIAYSANYDGHVDVYLMDIQGGVPRRMTQHGMADQVIDWHPDGKRILFASDREIEKERFGQFFTIDQNGGPATKLPLAYAEFGSYSPDGHQMALVFETQAFSTWKRYRGGNAADIYLFDFRDSSSSNISNAIDAGEEFPMWHGSQIYFISDNGPEKRWNLWSFDPKTKLRKQLTFYSEFDIHNPSLGPDEIVFAANGKIHLYAFNSGQTREIQIQLISDLPTIKGGIENADKFIQNACISKDGNRVILEARGELFSLPAEFGNVKNLTQSPGHAERNPSWSPDGRSLAYWSDASGEYELWIKNMDRSGETRKISNYGAGFRYRLFWSPDSKKLVFINQAMEIKMIDLEKNTTVTVDKGLRWLHGGLLSFAASWSPDSRWLSYGRDLDNWHQAIFIYDVQNQKTRQVTSGFYDCGSPAFDSEGKYLYVLTSQFFQPLYSDLDNTFIYANSTQLAAIPLRANTPSLLYARNDTVAFDKPEQGEARNSDSKSAKKSDAVKKDSMSSAKEKVTPVEIDFDQMEMRMEILPLSAGNYDRLSAVKGKILYLKYPLTGSGEQVKTSIRFYDIEKREEKTILEDANSYQLSADGKKILATRSGSYAVIKSEENQKFEKPLRIAEMEMAVDPKSEWKQIFLDCWRFERDYFYDPKMHGVNWDKVKSDYLKLLETAITREDVNFVIGEMIGELNASHTYRGGGDEESGKQKNVGYLGVNWKPDGSYYRISQIIRAADWDAEQRSPLDRPGLNIKEGDYILAVNGIPLTTQQEPYAAFEGLAGKTIEIIYNQKPDWKTAKTAFVETLNSESRLRNLAWIESNRKQVDIATKGEVGYIYVPSTGIDGQRELMRQFNAQWNKKALIIDERFNSGGQIPDRFIEMLNRQPLAFWAIRDGNAWSWPPFAHFGPKVMLINGWSGSGGDAFPDYFRKKKLGPLVGTRTWGGLIGISGIPTLIDRGGITAPTFRMYNLDGSWFAEGHGVDPDIEVMEDLSALAKGRDAQLQRAIDEVLQLLVKNPFKEPTRPAAEVR